MLPHPPVNFSSMGLYLWNSMSPGQGCIYRCADRIVRYAINAPIMNDLARMLLQGARPQWDLNRMSRIDERLLGHALWHGSLKSLKNKFILRKSRVDESLITHVFTTDRLPSLWNTCYLSIAANGNQLKINGKTRLDFWSTSFRRFFYVFSLNLWKSIILLRKILKYKRPFSKCIDSKKRIRGP